MGDFWQKLLQISSDPNPLVKFCMTLDLTMIKRRNFMSKHWDRRKKSGGISSNNFEKNAD